MITIELSFSCSCWWWRSIEVFIPFKYSLESQSWTGSWILPTTVPPARKLPLYDLMVASELCKHSAQITACGRRCRWIKDTIRAASQQPDMGFYHFSISQNTEQRGTDIFTLCSITFQTTLSIIQNLAKSCQLKWLMFFILDCFYYCIRGTSPSCSCLKIVLSFGDLIHPTHNHQTFVFTLPQSPNDDNVWCTLEIAPITSTVNGRTDVLAWRDECT